jgi:hypothetical protein
MSIACLGTNHGAEMARGAMQAIFGSGPAVDEE